MLRVERVSDDFRNLHRKLVHVEHGLLLSASGINYIILCPLRSFPFIPESVRVPEPVRSYLCGKHHPGDFFLGEPVRQFIVGFRSVTRNGFSMQACRRKECACYGGKGKCFVSHMIYMSIPAVRDGIKLFLHYGRDLVPRQGYVDDPH